MIRTRQSIVIDRPVDEVFEYLARFENDMEWRNELLEIQRVHGPAEGEGAVYRQRVQWEGYEGEETFEVVGFEPGRRLAYVARSGDIQEDGEYRLVAEDGRTKLELSAEMRLSGDFEEIEPELAGTVRQQGELDLEHLKDILEHRERWRQK